MQGNKQISRRQSNLVVTSGNSSSGSNSSRGRTTFSPLRAPSPTFGLPLRCDAGLAEGEYGAIHGQPPIDADDEVALRRALSRGKMKHTLAQAQAEEAPADAGREREKRHFREDFEVQMQDVINEFGTGTSPPSTQTFTNVFGICPLENLR